VGFDVLTTCQPSTVWCSRERLPAAAAQPAQGSPEPVAPRTDDSSCLRRVEPMALFTYNSVTSGGMISLNPHSLICGMEDNIYCVICNEAVLSYRWNKT
jgi:hypothetical protein